MVFDLHMLLRVGMALLVAGILSFALTPLVKMLAIKVGAMDIPTDERRMHSVPIPRMGGLAIFISFLLTVIIFSEGIDRQLQSILLGAVVIVILGVFDDILTLKAPLKLLVQIGAACIVVFYGKCRIEHFVNIDLGVFSIPLTLIWIVAITNAVNFIDGLDGLACGVCCISSVNMLVIALLPFTPGSGVAIVMATLAGACIGFLPFNFNPAKIFMGDTGSTFLGFVLASVSILGLFKFYAFVSFAVPFLLLGVPIFDICFAIIRRLAHGKNPMEADRGHVHHRLIDMGFSQKQSVAIAYILTAILGLSAVVLASSNEMRTIIFLGAVFVVGAIGITLIFKGTQPQETQKTESTEVSTEEENGET